MPIKVYLAGPYTKGDVGRNVAAAISAAQHLIERGFAVYVPHLSHLWHMLYPAEHKVWLERDFVWLEACDVVCRMPGDSEGADRECVHAKRLGIPVAKLADLYASAPVHKVFPPDGSGPQDYAK